MITTASNHSQSTTASLLGPSQIIERKGSVPIHLYLEELEQGAMEQAKNCARLPHAFHHISIMPDAHQGFAMPVGGVMALKNAVMPNAVGVDIGCGMLAARTSLRVESVGRRFEQLAEEILHTVPVGFQHHKKAQDDPVLDPIHVKGKAKKQLKESMPVVAEQRDSIPFQLGTLGGGNHFIELQRDEEGWLWVMIHSGSRNIGLKIANYYHKAAKNYCEDKLGGLSNDYAYLTLDLPEAHAYLEQMNWAIEFAAQNRSHIMRQVIGLMKRLLTNDVQTSLEVHTRHNYASWETHFGERVLVHRKGAVRARANELVTIPGSMGTCSYIGRGKGYADSFESCSHGAGRKMGRMQAKRQISSDDFAKQVRDVIVKSPNLSGIIDEAPAAYKDIEDVMSQQRHMVEVAYRLEPIAVVKG